MTCCHANNDCPLSDEKEEVVFLYRHKTSLGRRSGGWLDVTLTTESMVCITSPCKRQHVVFVLIACCYPAGRGAKSENAHEGCFERQRQITYIVV